MASDFDKLPKEKLTLTSLRAGRGWNIPKMTLWEFYEALVVGIPQFSPLSHPTEEIVVNMQETSVRKMDTVVKLDSVSYLARYIVSDYIIITIQLLLH